MTKRRLNYINVDVQTNNKTMLNQRQLAPPVPKVDKLRVNSNRQAKEDNVDCDQKGTADCHAE